jgi:hypothetical protein
MDTGLPAHTAAGTLPVSMLVDAEILVLPYAGEQQKTVLHLLIGELKNGRWSAFSAAVAFAKVSE